MKIRVVPIVVKARPFSRSNERSERRSRWRLTVFDVGNAPWCLATKRIPLRMRSRQYHLPFLCLLLPAPRHLLRDVSAATPSRPSCKFPVDVRLLTILLVFQMTCLPRTSLQIVVSLCSLEVTPSFKRLYSVSFSRLLRMIRIRKGGHRELFQSLHRRSDEAVSCRRPCSL